MTLSLDRPLHQCVTFMRRFLFGPDRKTVGQPRRSLSTFDLDYPLWHWSPSDGFTLRDAVTNILIMGGTGSGKTSGALRMILKTLFLAQYGGIIFTTKPGEYAQIRKWAEETGRLDSLIRFAPEEKHRFNFMTYASRLPGRGGGMTENIVRMLITIQESFERDGGAGGKQERFWALALEQLLRNAIDLRLIARPNESLSVRSLYDIIISAPISREQVLSDSWPESSECCRLIDEALNNSALTERQKADLEITANYFLREYPGLPGDTRGSVLSTFTTMADIFIRGEIGTLFSSGLNVIPELTQEGAIIVIDIPIKTYLQVGIAAQTLWKYLFEQSCERREVTSASRPLFLISDECHNIINKHDISFLTTARSSKCVSVYMTQTLSNIVSAMGGDQKGRADADAFVAAIANQIFCANTDPKTNAWAADIFGKDFHQKSHSGVTANEGKKGTSAGSNESLEYNVQPSSFVTLAKGGPENHFIVGAIVGSGGRIFNASRQTHIRTAFSQI